jgi:hypothetical protein
MHMHIDLSIWHVVVTSLSAAAAVTGDNNINDSSKVGWVRSAIRSPATIIYTVEQKYSDQ